MVGAQISAVRPGSPEAARPEGGAAGGGGPLVAVPGSRHRPRRRGLHQGAGAVVGARSAHWIGRARRIPSGTTPSPRSCWSRDRRGADRRRDARQRRQSARLRGPHARCCSARPRTITAPAPSARSFGCSMGASLSMTSAGGGGTRASGRRRVTCSRARARWARSAAIPMELVRQAHRPAAPVSRRLRGLPRHDVRPDRGPRQAGPRLHSPPGDRVRIASGWARSITASPTVDVRQPWTVGIAALMRNLSHRGLL